VCAYHLAQTIARLPNASRDQHIAKALIDHRALVGDVLIYKTQSRPRVPDSRSNQLAKFRRNLFAVYAEAAAAVAAPLPPALASSPDTTPRCKTCDKIVQQTGASW